MKFFAAMTFAAAASAAGAAKRDTVYEISEFSANCIPHSSQCVYSFGVLQPGTMQTTPIQCKAMVQASGTGQLPDVTEGGCEESSRTFNVVRGDKGLTFTVSAPVTPSSNLTGTYVIPETDIETSDEPNAVVESYSGPKSFNLS